MSTLSISKNLKIYKNMYIQFVYILQIIIIIFKNKNIYIIQSYKKFLSTSIYKLNFKRVVNF